MYETRPKKQIVSMDETKKRKERYTTMARHRKVMNGAKDRRMFNVTARKTKTINLSQKPMRGGIRL